VYKLARPLLFRIDAERAHDLALAALVGAHRLGLAGRLASRAADLPVRAFGLDFPNPVGLAAGLDKNGACVDALAALGFGFVEVGTVTPRPQPGNPKPRLFRLPGQGAVINRLGFNNVGVDGLLRNLERVRSGVVLGVNIGRNKDTPNERAADDYLTCFKRVAARASYVTVNISSPNTAGLRELQQADALTQLIGRLRDAQERLAAIHGKRTPLLLKIAPDLDPPALDAIAHAVLASGVDGLICTNTTLSRDGAAGRHADEVGGLSGRPLFARATAVLEGMRQRLAGRIALIGVGGVASGDNAAAKIAAGASLVQLYTGLVYRGPALIGESIEAIRAASHP
jgi:dihydroorotate dehydrogenase